MNKIIILPKNLVLFKCIINKEDNAADFYGIQKDDIFCMPIGYNCYFYPQPYIIDSNNYFRSPDRNIYIYKLNKSIKLFFVYDEAQAIQDGIIVPCNNISYCNGLVGNKYDICLTKQFIKNNPDIVGCIRVVKADNKHHEMSVKKKYYKFDNSINMNINTIMEPRLRDVEGIPEFIIYPIIKQIQREIITKKIDIQKNKFIIEPEPNNKHKYNYQLIAKIAHQPYQKDELYKYMRKMLHSKQFIYKDGFYYYDGV